MDKSQRRNMFPFGPFFSFFQLSYRQTFFSFLGTFSFLVDIGCTFPAPVTTMGQAKYAAVPQAATEDGSGVEEDAVDAAGLDRTRRSSSSSSSSSPSRYELAKKALFYASVAILALVLGFCLGREHEHRRMAASPSPATSALPGSVGGNKGLLSPQALIPEGTLR